MKIDRPIASTASAIEWLSVSPAPRTMLVEEEPELNLEISKGIGFGEVSLVPPSNFAMVDRGIYRSAIPEEESFGFLETMRLQSVLYLCPEAYLASNAKSLESHGIQFFSQLGIEGKASQLQ